MRRLRPLVATSAVAQFGPAVTQWGPVRRVMAPALSGVGRSDHIAITFDDGPVPESTPSVLAALAELGWRATFFMLGDNIRANRRLAAAVVDAGHEVALHGDRHVNTLRQPPWQVYAELRRARQALISATGVVPRWYRPPYGLLSGPAWAAARALRLRPMLWTAMGRDWEATAHSESIVAEVARDLRGGGTILLHDFSASGSWRATVDALPGVAETAARLGCAVGPLCEHRIGEAGRRPDRMTA